MTAIVLLFDLDETLVAQERAFERAYREAGTLAARSTGVDAVSFAAKIPVAAERALAVSPIAAPVRRCRFGGRDLLWGSPGTTSGPSVRIARHLVAFRREVFHAVLRDVGVECPALAEELPVAFRRAMFSALHPFPDVIPCLRRLSQHHRLAVVTNGMHEAQSQKLRHLGLDGHFEAVVASADVGIGKPARSIFDAALETMGSTPGDTWMVGDSLEGDVLGAMAAGLKGVWLNRRHEPLRAFQRRAATPIAELHGLSAWTPGNIH